MKKKAKNELIGLNIAVPNHIRPEYLNHSGRPPCFVIIEFYKDKRYGAVAKIFQRNSAFDRYEETTTKKERQDISKRMSTIGKDTKPLDTSKWVKPDEESIRNELIRALFMLEILQEDAPEYDVYYGKAQAFYSILHGHSPRNPQSLNNWCIDPYFGKIMDEEKCIESKKYWKHFSDEFKKDLKSKKKKTYEDWENRQANYQTWKANMLKHMIIKDPKPHEFKEHFGLYKKEELVEKIKEGESK